MRMIFLFKNSYEYFYREALLAISKKNQTKEYQLIQGSFIKNNFSFQNLSRMVPNIFVNKYQNKIGFYSIFSCL